MKKQAVNLGVPTGYPFPEAIKSEHYIFVSGQGAESLQGIEAQLKQCFGNIKEILSRAGSSLEDVVKVSVFLKNAEDFPKLNEVYQSYFPKEPPARSTVITGLVLPGMLVEVDCIAAIP